MAKRKTSFQKCMAKELKGKHCKGKKSCRAKFKKAARKCRKKGKR